MVRVAPAFTPDFAPTTPLHGYRGEVAAATARPPRGLTVAITREAGARGGRIARRVGQLLGWQVFDQEMLGYLVQSETARAEMMADVPPDSLAWANLEHARQLDARHLGGGDQTELLRLAFVLAAKGDSARAITLFREAVALRPNAPSFASARYNLGLLLIHEGRKSDGLAQLREAVRLNPALRR